MAHSVDNIFYLIHVERRVKISGQKYVYVKRNVSEIIQPI